ncbi:hypothetical protein RYX36_017705 [Vicia faba]
MMESLTSSSSSTTLPSFSIFPSTTIRTSSLSSKKTLHFRIPASKRDDAKDSDEINVNINLPVLSNQCFSISPLSNDAAMGLVLSAATGRGWTTGSGMEGPPVPAVGKDDELGTGNISTFPWSLFTKSPRRRMLIAFTCTICGQRTTRAINPHAYNDGTVFVQVAFCFSSTNGFFEIPYLNFILISFSEWPVEIALAKLTVHPLFNLYLPQIPFLK